MIMTSMSHTLGRPSGDNDGSKENRDPGKSNDEADGTNEDNDNNPIVSPVDPCPHQIKRQIQEGI
jgi:hypothetical protein